MCKCSELLDGVKLLHAFQSQKVLPTVGITGDDGFAIHTVTYNFAQLFTFLLCNGIIFIFAWVF